MDLQLPPATQYCSPHLPPPDLDNSLSIKRPIETVPIWLVGRGPVASEFCRELAEKSDFLANEGLVLHVAGIANRSGSQIAVGGFNGAGSGETLHLNGGIDNFVARMIGANIPRSIFVDCSGSTEVGDLYEEILLSGIHIVTPNKVAQSAEFAQYQRLKEASALSGARFVYSVSVGAGLPVLSTISDLVASGDQVRNIVGVLSGTLSYVFNHYNGTEPFADVVRQACEKNIAERDPRIDLSGIDMARKLVIAAREAGWRGGMKECRIETPIPHELFEANNVDSFMRELRLQEPYFLRLWSDAIAQEKRLAYLGEYDGKEITLALRMIGRDHPCYGLQDADNLVSISTDRYETRPLVIAGPGAGKEISGGNVLRDVIKVIRGR